MKDYNKYLERRKQTFWNNMTKQENGCWTWDLCKDKDGYGYASFRSITMKAHRLAYFLHHNLDKFPTKMVIHSCDNPACCNPSHLRLGSNSDNVQDMISRGRINPPKGDRNGQAKLSNEEAMTIRTSALPAKEIAAKFNVCATTVYLIKANKIYTTA